MLKLTDELIDATIDGISGFITANFSEKYDIPLEKSLELFLSSKTYYDLSRKETGYYWDSIPEIQDTFFREYEECVRSEYTIDINSFTVADEY